MVEHVTKRFWLRPIMDADLPELLRNFSDPAMMKFYDGQPLSSMAEVEEMIARWRRWERKGTGVRWAIALKDSGRLIGSCGFHDIDRRVGCAEIGCEVTPEFWGCGVMPELVPFLGYYAFDVLGLKRVDALIAPENRPSVALVRKFGFRKRRVLRAHRIVNGRNADIVAFTLTRASYRVAKYSRLASRLVALPMDVREIAARCANWVGALAPSRLRSS